MTKRTHAMETAIGQLVPAVDALTAMMVKAFDIAGPDAFGAFGSFSCRVGVERASRPEIRRTSPGNSLPNKAPTAHGRVRLATMQAPFQALVDQAQLALVDAASALTGLGSFDRPGFAVGFDIARNSATGWIATGKGHTLIQEASPLNSHTLAKGQFAAALRVAAASDGWDEGDWWTFQTANQPKPSRIVHARDATAAALKIWCLHHAGIFDKPSDHTLARIEPNLGPLLRKAKRALPTQG